MKSSELKFANPKLRDIEFEVKTRPNKHLTIGIILRILIFIIPVITLTLVIFLASSMSGCFLTSVILFLLAGTKISISEIYRLSKRYLHNPLKVLLRDKRAPVLYLRSFRNQHEKISYRRDEKTPEELLAFTLEQVGPVIAVGQPREIDLPFLGATRIYIDNNWKAKVEQLISISQMVLIDADTTENVLWEINTAKKMLNPSKLIISFLARQETENFKMFYNKFSKKFDEIFFVSLPQYNPNACFIYFTDNWQPQFIELEKTQAKQNGGCLTGLAFGFPEKPYITQENIKKALYSIISNNKITRY